MYRVRNDSPEERARLGWQAFDTVHSIMLQRDLAARFFRSNAASRLPNDALQQVGMLIDDLNRIIARGIDRMYRRNPPSDAVKAQEWREFTLDY
jgi:hypothetical protein